MKKTRKNFLLSVILLATVFTLFSCGGSTKESSSKPKQDKLEQIKQKGELNIGTSPDFPPMEFYILNEDGKREIAGSDISLAQAIADELDVNLKITATDFDGVIANIQAAGVDFGISGFTFTEGRAEVMQFSTGYNQESSGYQGLLVTKETAAKYDTLEEFTAGELKLGAQGGSIQYEMAENLTAPENIKQYGTLDISLLALNAGDIDAIVVSTSSAEPMLETFPNLTILPEEGFNLDPEGLYSQNMIGFPLGEEYESLIEVANEVIDEAIESGQYEEWQEEAKDLSSKAVE